MGLDITAYKGLKLVENLKLDKDGYPTEYGTYYSPRSLEESNYHFPGRCITLKAEDNYSFKKKFSFRAGSYSGYNRWRNELAKFIGLKSSQYIWDIYQELKKKGTPFIELINFSDCEGVIAGSCAAKLFIDFRGHLDKAETKDTFFLESYKNWLKAFEYASNLGAVDFH